MLGIEANHAVYHDEPEISVAVAGRGCRLTVLLRGANEISLRQKVGFDPLSRSAERGVKFTRAYMNNAARSVQPQVAIARFNQASNASGAGLIHEAKHLDTVSTQHGETICPGREHAMRGLQDCPYIPETRFAR